MTNYETGRPRTKLQTLAGSLSDALREARSAATRVVWPQPYYQTRIIEFVENVLGVRTHKRMRDMLLAIQNNKKVAIRSGHRVSKTCTLACASLWFAFAFPGGRVAATAPTNTQVREAWYKDVTALHGQSGICWRCRKAGLVEAPCEHSAKLDGRVGMLPRTGIRCSDGRQIFGFSARRGGNLQGIAGANLMLIGDEAAEIRDEIFESYQGNRAGGAWEITAGNPTTLRGYFFDAFHSKARFFTTLTISSYESPNITGEFEVPGLATTAWCEERKEDWGDSPEFTARVLGLHPSIDTEARPFPREKLRAAVERNATAPAEGLLHIGADVAMADSHDGRNDDSVFAVRRGQRMLDLSVCSRYSADELLAELLRLIGEHAEPGETPVVVVDRLGLAGKVVGDAFRAHTMSHPNAFRIVFIRESDAPARDPEIYARQGDCMVGQFAKYLAAGGGLWPDTKLVEELQCFEWRTNSKGKSYLIGKPQIKRQLRPVRSPDRADATVLSCWEDPTDARDFIRRQVARRQQSAPSAPQRARGGSHSGRSYWR